MRTFRFPLVTLAALALSMMLASGNISPSRAQSDDASEDSGPTFTPPDQGNPNASTDSSENVAAEQAQDAVDAAEQALQAARDDRNRLQSEGAPKEQIEAADQAISQAQAEKDAADEEAQRAEQAAGTEQDN